MVIKIDNVSGRGEYVKRATSSAGTVERTSARRESRRDKKRLPRAVMPWLAGNSRVLDPERISLSKSARTSTGKLSRKPPQVDSHQSNQEATSHTPGKHGFHRRNLGGGQRNGPILNLTCFLQSN